MPVKLSTTVHNIDTIPNKENQALVKEFYEFMKSSGTSEKYQNNNLKTIIAFGRFLDPSLSFYAITKREQIIKFLDTKIKDIIIDPDKRWITTWNDYLSRIKYFFRWFYNTKNINGFSSTYFDVQAVDYVSINDWKTPIFLNIDKRKTKRISPYIETELWEKDDILSIIKYEVFKRNKAALTLLWDLDARPHEVTLLKIKHIRLKEKYGEGEIPHEAKTGTGPILLTSSFSYVRDWLNEHPFKNEANASLICNIKTGAPITAEALWTVMKQLQKRIIRLLKEGSIKDIKEREKLEFLLRTKKWNPYCIRHSAITSDSDYLPEYALKKKVRWSMNSRQGSRYIKRRMGDELKNKILIHDGIIDKEPETRKMSILNCPRCELINAFENKYCSKCSYPLGPEAFEEIKKSEEIRFSELEVKYKQEIDELKVNMEKKFEQLLTKIDLVKMN
jgi:integrase/recombinase XerD